MKSIFMCLIIVVAALGGGYSIGFGISWFEYQNTEEYFFSDQWGTVGEYGDGSVGVIGVLGSDTHDFGPMVSGQAYRAEFIFENSGGSTIEISVLDKSDNISTDLLETYSIKAGTTYPVEINITAPDTPGELSGFISINTNDPNPERQTIRLNIKGHIEADEATKE